MPEVPQEWQRHWRANLSTRSKFECSCRALDDCLAYVHTLDFTQPFPVVAVSNTRISSSRFSRLKTKPRGFIATGTQIVSRETPLALYKGLGAVMGGIIPKMAIRFASFETYKSALADKQTGKTNLGGIFVCACARLTLLPVKAVILMLDFHFRVHSRIGGWSHRSCHGRDAHGSSEDSTPSANALSRRPT